MPILHRLARRAPEGSEESLFAHRQLAELVAERNPWRASLHARKVLRHRPDDDRAWATLALCLTMMGHYRYAVTAYRNALEADPENPWYAHNLGHLLDVALGRAEEAVPWLLLAQEAAPWSAEMATSCAHALARAGRVEEAKRIASKVQKTRPSRELTALLKWLGEGAPEGGHLSVTRPTSLQREEISRPDGAPLAPRRGRFTPERGVARESVARESVARESVARESVARESVAAERAAAKGGAPGVTGTSAPSAGPATPAPVGDAPAARRRTAARVAAPAVGPTAGEAPPLVAQALASEGLSPAAAVAGAAASLPAVAPVLRARRSRGTGRRSAKPVVDSPLHRVLRRGLSHLPLSDRQRERAVEMAEDAFANGNAADGDERTLFSVASALAYAMVYVDRVPLTQAEVAACFRVSVSSLRGRFGALRTRLALTPGDVRWRTLERK